MARRTHTYAIRLAVEGGGQVKAELVSVGQSGEQSLKRIETAGERASGGLKGLGRQAELLRAGIRTLGGALIGAATVGGLAALIERSISAADAIGKTADKIGVGVEALQELRFAAKASGVEQQTLDIALQRFTRRAAEAAQGTGKAKDALAQMGIALRDQSGNLRRSEDLLADVADAFARIEDPAERVRLAFKLFDSEGVALVNLLADGSGALEEMRERARDLGIVLDEHLVRDAERARTELDTLSQVISANLTRAALEAAPVIADLSSWLADVAGKAGIAWERLFDAPEEKSLRTLRYELDFASSTIEKLEDRIEELRESPTLGFTTFLDTAQINALETKLDELRRARDQTQARIAFLEGPPDTGVPAPVSAPAPDNAAGVQERAKNLERIARELEGTLFSITHHASRGAPCAAKVTQSGSVGFSRPPPVNALCRAPHGSTKRHRSSCGSRSSGTSIGASTGLARTTISGVRSTTAIRRDWIFGASRSIARPNATRLPAAGRLPGVRRSGLAARGRGLLPGDHLRSGASGRRPRHAIRSLSDRGELRARPDG